MERIDTQCQFCSYHNYDYELKEIILQTATKEFIELNACGDCFYTLKIDELIHPVLDHETEAPDWLYLLFDDDTLDMKAFKTFHEFHSSCEGLDKDRKYLFGCWRESPDQIDQKDIDTLLNLDKEDDRSSKDEEVILRDWSASKEIYLAIRGEKDYHTVSPVPNKFSRGEVRLTYGHTVSLRAQEIRRAVGGTNKSFLISDDIKEIRRFIDPLENDAIEWFNSIEELEKSRWLAKNRADCVRDDGYWSANNSVYENLIIENSQLIKKLQDRNDEYRRALQAEAP